MTYKIDMIGINMVITFCFMIFTSKFHFKVIFIGCDVLHIIPNYVLKTGINYIDLDLTHLFLLFIVHGIWH